MKNRVFSTERLAQSIKALVDASGVGSRLYMALHMKPAYYAQVINGEQTI